MDAVVSKVRIHVTRESDVAEAARQARLVAAGLGFAAVQTHYIATAASELAANLLIHAGNGIFEIYPFEERDGVELMAADRGPGISDVDQAMQEGYSTAGGLGCGLPGVQRLMDAMSIDSRPGGGTVVKACKWL